MVLQLDFGWRMRRLAPDEAKKPEDVNWGEGLVSATVPGTVASTLLGSFYPDKPPNINYDDFDWWYECTFSIQPDEYRSLILQFDGLATIAEIWLNGNAIGRSENMFRQFSANVGNSIRESNTLTVVFRSLSRHLDSRKARPRWKTNLVANQQLRWARTTLLGRIPGWTPAISPVGPWRDIRLCCNRWYEKRSVSLLATAMGNTGCVSVDVVVNDLHPTLKIESAVLNLAGRDYTLEIDTNGKNLLISTRLEIGNIRCWWPRGEGNAHLYSFTVSLDTNHGKFELENGTIGFRTVATVRDSGRLAFTVNGQEVFAKGACWTNNDIISLVGDPEALEDCLTLFQQAGGNMIRIGGTMVYETDHFYATCDKLGIMVWQDFMFANMDYPSDDADFLASVVGEVQEQLLRLRSHPCVIAWCGNSEVEQQAAMYGNTADVWKNELFYRTIPEQVERLNSAIPYFPSSPCEGDLPFHSNDGPAHYFGVGAYKQPLASIATADVKFATECLAFSNVPDDPSLRLHFGNTTPAVHHPSWKAGVPRDASAGWDFEDIRDFYMNALYALDPVALRYADKARYKAISQVVTGEVMQSVFDYWQSDASKCGGGLIWFLRDIVPGAGWGLIDSDGKPKALYYLLRRCWSTTRLYFRDLGMDGQNVCVYHDSDVVLDGTVEIQLLQSSRTCIASASKSVRVSRGNPVELSLDGMLGRFLDPGYRYRFGPPKHDVILATLRSSDGRLLMSSCFFPGSRDIFRHDSAEIAITTITDGGATYLRIRSDRLLQFARLTSRTHSFTDNYVHVPPHTDVDIAVTAISNNGNALRGSLAALNLVNSVRFR